MYGNHKGARADNRGDGLDSCLWPGVSMLEEMARTVDTVMGSDAVHKVRKVTLFPAERSRHYRKNTREKDE